MIALLDFRSRIATQNTSTASNMRYAAMRLLYQSTFGNLKVTILILKITGKY